MASISGEDISISVKGVASVIDTLTAADIAELSAILEQAGGDGT